MNSPRVHLWDLNDPDWEVEPTDEGFGILFWIFVSLTVGSVVATVLVNLVGDDVISVFFGTMVGFPLGLFTAERIYGG